MDREIDIVKIIEELHGKLDESLKETRILYEISDIEALLLIHIVQQVLKMGYSNKLMARILKAAAHFVEQSGEAMVETSRKLE